MKINKIFLDLDGVCADMYRAMSEEFDIPDIKNNVTSQQFFEEYLVTFTDNGGFARIPPMPKIYELVKAIMDIEKKIPVEILTSHGSFYKNSEIVVQQKRSWLHEYFPKNLSQLPFNVSSSGKGKANWARPKHLLIDDTAANIDSFKEAGGEAFLYTVDKQDELFSLFEKIKKEKEATTISKK